MRAWGWLGWLGFLGLFGFSRFHGLFGLFGLFGFYGLLAAGRRYDTMTIERSEPLPESRPRTSETEAPAPRPEARKPEKVGVR